ncbi:hypothetical protein D3C78_820200 [compost metagenome]
MQQLVVLVLGQYHGRLDEIARPIHGLAAADHFAALVGVAEEVQHLFIVGFVGQGAEVDTFIQRRADLQLLQPSGELAENLVEA